MKTLNILKETDMDKLFKQPANDTDVRFVMRCLWALDPDRHLFAGDFRDYARLVFERWLSYRGQSWDIPSECVDEIGQLALEFPCSDSTRRCWQKIAEHMKAHLHTVRFMQLAQDDRGLLEEFVRRSSPGRGGKYCVIEEDLPRELLMARRLGFNATLEAVAGGLRSRLDPKTLTGAILLWTLWCLATKWPEGKAAGHYRTPFSLSWQLAREVEGPCGDRDAWGISRLVSQGANLRTADALMRSRKGGRPLAHGFARHATVKQLALLRKAGLPLDDPDEVARRPLQEAIMFKKWHNAVWLSKGADPNSRPEYLDPAIVLSGDKRVPPRLLLSLLDRGADPDARGKCRRTALHAAAFSGNLPAALALIGRGAELEPVDTWGHTPLYRAAFAMVAGEGNRLPVIDALVSAGANPDPSGPGDLTLKAFLLRSRELGAPAERIETILRALHLQ